MPASPNAGSMRIPGLDEPVLQMPNMQQLIVPGQGSPLAPNLSSTSASAGGQALSMSYRTAPSPVSPAFQTQLPNFASGQVVGGMPPSSVSYSSSPVTYPATSIRMQP